MTTVATGVKLTVDSTDFELKFQRTVDALKDGLTKAQKAMHLTYDESKTLVDQWGRCVEGLSKWQINLGMYVDDLGKIRTVNDGFVDGLSRAELEMGRYVDAMGRVCKMNGEFVRDTGKAAKAQQEFAGAMSEFAGNLSQTANEFGEIAAQFATSSDSAARVQAVFAKTSQSVGFMSGLYKTTLDLGRSFNKVKDSAGAFFKTLQQAKGAGGALGALKGALPMLGGPAGIAAAGITAGVGAAVLAYKAYQAHAEREKEINEGVAKSFDIIAERARRAGEEIRTIGDALKYSKAFGATFDEFEAAANKFELAINAVRIARENYRREAQSDDWGTADLYGVGQANVEYSKLQNAIENANEPMKEYLELAQKMVETARQEQRTEVETLEIQLARYSRLKQDLESRTEGEEELDQLAESMEVIDKQILSLGKKIEEAKKKEAEVAYKKARDEAGITKYLEQTQVSVMGYAEAVANWRANAEKLGLSQERLEKAIANRAQEELDALARSTGVSFLKEEGDARARWAKALEDGFASQTQYNEALKQIAEKELAAAKTLDEKFEIARQNNLDARELQAARHSELEQVVDSIESQEDYAAAMDAIADYYARGEIVETASLMATAQRKLAESLAREREEARDALASRLGVTFKDESAVSYERAMKELVAAREKDWISAEELTAARDQLREKELEASPLVADLARATVGTVEAENRHAETLKELDRLYAEDKMSEARYLELKAKENARERERLDAIAAQNKSKFDAFVGKEKDPIKELNERYKELAELYKDDAEAMRRLRKARADQIKAIRDAEAEEKRRKRAEEIKSQRDKLGVDALMEDLKSPLEKYRETMDAIARAAKDRAITRDERIALEEKATRDYWEAFQELGERTEEVADKVGKFQMANSMKAGSVDLYQASVRNASAGFQTRVQRDTNQLVRNTSQALYQQQAGNAILEQVVGAIANIGVWR